VYAYNSKHISQPNSGLRGVSKIEDKRSQSSEKSI
jgi:hypothetical protein